MKNCIECGAKIPLRASKCRECGSLQDYRRFFSLTQSSLSFFLALTGLSLHFSGEIRGYYYSIRDFITGTQFSMDAGLVDVDASSMTVILSSRRNFAFAVSGATCFVNLPVDPRKYTSVTLMRNDKIWGVDDHDVHDELKWIGPIIIAYSLENPEFFEPHSIKMITFKREHVGFPTASIGIKTADSDPTSACSFIGADQNNSWVASALVTDPRNLRGLDAMELLQGQTGLDPESGEEAMRVQLLQKVQAAREQQN